MPKKKPQPPFKYGQSPSPTNWREGAEALASVQRARRPKRGGLLDRLDRLESALKEKK